jgi:hypothetical protein
MTKILTKDEFAKSLAVDFSDAVESAYQDLINQAVAAEREACAKVCEEASTPVAGEILTDGQWASKILAGKIRARGNL